MQLYIKESGSPSRQSSHTISRLCLGNIVIVNVNHIQVRIPHVSACKGVNMISSGYSIIAFSYITVISMYFIRKMLKGQYVNIEPI